jgi:hypothetical protein
MLMRGSGQNRLLAYNTNLQNYRLVIASSAPTGAADPPWMKQPESESVFFSLLDQNSRPGEYFLSVFFSLLDQNGRPGEYFLSVSS